MTQLNRNTYGLRFLASQDKVRRWNCVMAFVYPANLEGSPTRNIRGKDHKKLKTDASITKYMAPFPAVRFTRDFANNIAVAGAPGSLRQFPY